MPDEPPSAPGHQQDEATGDPGRLQDEPTRDPDLARDEPTRDPGLARDEPTRDPGLARDERTSDPGLVRDELVDHPDRRRWNARYAGPAPSFDLHELAGAANALTPPRGPVLELACGPSGSALAWAAAGRLVTAVDVSDVALRFLRAEAGRRGVLGLIDIVHADLATWRPAPGQYALVACAGYWDREVFAAAAAAVADGGVLAWQALTAAARSARPSLPAAWCLGPGEPGALLPPGFTIVQQADLSAVGQRPAETWRRLLARRAGQDGDPPRRPGRIPAAMAADPGAAT